MPTTWADIEVGALVLASEAPGHGFFETVVVGAPGGDLFELRWVGWPELPFFVRRREHIALLTEALVTMVEQPDAAPETAAEAQPAEA